MLGGGANKTTLPPDGLANEDTEAPENQPKDPRWRELETRNSGLERDLQRTQDELVALKQEYDVLAREVCAQSERAECDRQQHLRVCKVQPHKLHTDPPGNEGAQVQQLVLKNGELQTRIQQLEAHLNRCSGENQQLEACNQQLEQDLRICDDQRRRLEARCQQLEMNIKNFEQSQFMPKALPADSVTPLGTASMGTATINYKELSAALINENKSRVQTGCEDICLNDIVIFSYGSGTEVGQRLRNYLSNSHTCQLGQASSREEMVRCAVGAKRAVIVILSDGSMHDDGCVLGMLAADEAHQRVILVHEVESCRFPSYDQMPKNKGGSISISFDSKAIVYLAMYEEHAFVQVQQRVQRVHKPKPTEEGCSVGHGVRQSSSAAPLDGAPSHLKGKAFRLFYSHRQLSGRYAVHRTHEALRERYWGFLDVDAGDLELHNLVKLVQSAHTLLIYISEGYFDSQYCILELVVAMTQKLKLMFVRDYSCGTLPHMASGSSFAGTLAKVWSAYGQDMAVFGGSSCEEMRILVERCVQQHWEHSVVYHPEVFEEYIHKLHYQLGPSDSALDFLQSIPDGVELKDAAGVNVDLCSLQHFNVRALGSNPDELLNTEGDFWHKVTAVTVRAEIDANFEMLITFLCNLQNVQMVHLRGMKMLDHGVSTMAAKVAMLPHLKVLDLSKNGITNEGVKNLMKYFVKHESLCELKLQEGVFNTSLNTLHLGENNIGNEGAEALAAALSPYEEGVFNTSLNTLILELNNIGPEGAKALAVALTPNAEGVFNTSLNTLDLNANGIGPEGAKALAVALTPNAEGVFNTSLNTLNLEHNDIGPEGAKALAVALTPNAGGVFNTSLNTLYLYDNRVGDEGAKALAVALTPNAEGVFNT
ncbi:hypothetical protein CYMTET_7513, partial [Cymbomonas tetramitiformis]